MIGKQIRHLWTGCFPPSHPLCQVPRKVIATFLELPWTVFMSFKQTN